MTDMAITACVPLPGEGLVARRGGLVIVTDGQADGSDPLLGALCGDAGREPRFALGTLSSDVHVKTGLTRFLPARLRSDLTVEPVKWQGSGDLASTSQSNCFLVVPADRPLLAAGETVTILLAS